MVEKYRLGLIVNPIAGMGGSIGLKGTDHELAARAKALGAAPIAMGRAIKALSQLAGLGKNLLVFTCSGEMGENVARKSGLESLVVSTVRNGVTTANDTKVAAMRIVERQPDLLLFAGGDGTARDLLEVVGETTPLLGVPSGVKMHSAVFAATARAAGEVVRKHVLADNRDALLRDAEILDRELSRPGSGPLSPRLYGIVRTPRLSFLVPGAKSSIRLTGKAALQSAVRRVVELVGDELVSLLGPGSTMQLVKQSCGFEGTPLGVDAVANGRCLATDLNERAILELVRNQSARIVISIVGGQGFLFGRGNQQLSPRVIRTIGTDRIVVLSSLEKLAALPGRCLLVDTGDDRLDDELAGFREVNVSEARTALVSVRSAGREAPT